MADKASPGIRPEPVEGRFPGFQGMKKNAARSEGPKAGRMDLPVAEVEAALMALEQSCTYRFRRTRKDEDLNRLLPMWEAFRGA